MDTNQHPCIMEARIREIENRMGRGDEKFININKEFIRITNSIEKIEKLLDKTVFWLMTLMGTTIVSLFATVVNLLSKKP